MLARYSLRPLSSLLLCWALWGCEEDPLQDVCSPNPCFMERTCTPTNEGASCEACPPGMEGDGKTCTETDGCASTPCFPDVDCTDIPAPGTGFSCGDCPVGFEGDGQNCTDIDGCANASCFAGVDCTDVPAPGTGFNCGDCPPGMMGDGQSCAEIDGCEGEPCFPNVTCTDVLSPGTGFSCGSCPAGLEGDGETCTEIDECASMPCFADVDCTDIPAPGTGFSCGDCPVGFEGDGQNCTDIDGCANASCFAGVDCTDVPAPGTGFSCGDCPSGLEGDGQICTEIDGCSGDPCLPSSTCTDIPAPGTGFNCSPCVGVNCPIFRALAGPDQSLILGQTATLQGDAVDFNGSFSCIWTAGNLTLTTCSATVSPSIDTVFTLTVTDASGAIATDQMSITITDFSADAGPDSNVLLGQTATLTASWAGASCPDASCISCEWQLSDQTPVASTCTATVSPSATTQYFLTVTDVPTGRAASDSATVFITDQPAQLCGWDVVVLTSNEYPTGANPNYICDGNGTARRQTVNGKPAIVLSDLVVSNVRITGYISVETTGDDDLIGFLWGFRNPKHYYLMQWKQLSQNWTANCGNAPAGIAIKKVDGATTAPDTISFNPSFGFNATDYVNSCATFWSTDRANGNLLFDNTVFLASPVDPGGFTSGWADLTTYRVEFYYTPTRTKIFVYEDDAQTGSTTAPVTNLTITDSSYPEGGFAFFSNSQAQVAFGDFTLASLFDFSADAGANQTITPGGSAQLTGTANLAVPPYQCEWSDGTMTLMSNNCALSVSPVLDTTYTLMITDNFGRVATDEVTVFISP